MKRFVLAAFLAIVLILGGTSTVLWKKGLVQTWAEARIAEVYFEKIRPELPFTVEKIEVKKDWSELLHGRLASLHLVISKGGWRFVLEGPLRFPKASTTTVLRLLGRKVDGREDLRITFTPHVRVIPPKSLGGANAGPAPFDAKISVWGAHSSAENGEKVQIDGVQIIADGDSSKWNWPALGLELDHPDIEIHWKAASGLQVDIGSKSVTWENAGKEKAISVIAPRIDATVPLTLQPFAAGPVADVSWTGKSGEVLWGDHYFSSKTSAPLTGAVHITVPEPLRLGKDTPPPPWRNWVRAEAQIGPESARAVRVEGELKPSKNGTSLRLNGKTASLPLRPLLDEFSSMNALGLKRGTVRASLNGEFRLDRPVKDGQFQGSLHFENVALKTPSAPFAASGVKVSLPFSSKTGITGKLEAAQLAFRHLQGKLKPTTIRITPKTPARDQFAVSVGDEKGTIPLEIAGTATQLGALVGNIALGDPLVYQLVTSFTMQPTTVTAFTTPLCVRNESRVPSTIVQMTFPKITFTPGAIDLNGSARADLFAGSVTLNEIGIYDADTGVPEIDFNLNATHLRLDYIGSFLNFGEMDGTLEGYAKDVVLQGWLPTQYTSRLEVRPLRKKRVVFSPPAMKNFARLFAEEAIDHLPGWVDLLAFGWFSREILRGFDINYAGIQANSANGFITVETLDPPQARSEGKHFILNGFRFKMPLNTSRYPLVLDADAMRAFVQRKMQVLEEISKKEPLNEPDPDSCQPVLN